MSKKFSKFFSVNFIEKKFWKFVTPEFIEKNFGNFKKMKNNFFFRTKKRFREGGGVKIRRKSDLTFGWVWSIVVERQGSFKLLKNIFVFYYLSLETNGFSIEDMDNIIERKRPKKSMKRSKSTGRLRWKNRNNLKIQWYLTVIKNFIIIHYYIIFDENKLKILQIKSFKSYRPINNWPLIKEKKIKASVFIEIT